MVIRFKSRIKRFSHRFITSVDKRTVMDYLSQVLDTSSAINEISNTNQSSQPQKSNPLF